MGVDIFFCVYASSVIRILEGKLGSDVEYPDLYLFVVI